MRFQPAPRTARSFLPVLALATLGVAGCATPDGSFAELATPGSVGSEEPFLATDEDRLYLSWIESDEAAPPRLRLASYADGVWSEPTTIVEDDRMFVNWADFPSVSIGPDGSIAAHWLIRQSSDGYAYDAWVSVSRDGGATWEEPARPYRDDSATQHGFVALAASPAGYDLVWLDGRDTSDHEGEMKLIHSRWSNGAFIDEQVLDADVCSCCQTDALAMRDGLLVVYRDHDPDQVRDISTVRLRDGNWSEPRRVHDDGWKIAGCPVNGPALAGPEERPAVAWFTEAGGEPRVLVAFSEDGGDTFATPFVVDDGNPLGRVDLVALEDGTLVVSWLEKTTDRAAEVRLRRVRAGQAPGPSQRVGAVDAGRPSGFPRLAVHDDRIHVAWTDTTAGPSRIRLFHGNPPLLGP